MRPPGSATSRRPARRASRSRVLPAEMQKLLATDEIKARLVSLGLDARSSTPEEMGAFLKREQERYGSIIKSQNIKVEQ